MCRRFLAFNKTSPLQPNLTCIKGRKSVSVSSLIRKGDILTLYRRIVFSLVAMALAIAPGTVRHSKADDVEPLQQTCSVNYRDLIRNLHQEGGTSDKLDEISQVFCNHFSAASNHQTHTSNGEMVHITPLFLVVEIEPIIVQLGAAVVLFPRNFMPDSLHPEVPPHPPKASRP